MIEIFILVLAIISPCLSVLFIFDETKKQQDMDDYTSGWNAAVRLWKTNNEIPSKIVNNEWLYSIGFNDAITMLYKREITE